MTIIRALFVLRKRTNKAPNWPQTRSYSGSIPRIDDAGRERLPEGSAATEHVTVGFAGCDFVGDMGEVGEQEDPFEQFPLALLQTLP